MKLSRENGAVTMVMMMGEDGDEKVNAYREQKFNFWISGFLYLFGFPAVSQERKELPEIRWCQNNHIF